MKHATTTTADFAAARFATHPDGRIAARLITNENGVPWRVAPGAHDPAVLAPVRDDEAMAAEGWALVRALDDLTGSGGADLYDATADDDDPQGPVHTRHTTAPAVDYEAMWWRAERQQGEARTMAALWKETARRAIQNPATLARWEKDLLIEDFESNGPVYTTGERDRHRAQIERAERALADVHERDETVARLEARLVKAEQDRNRWRELAEMAECHDCIRDAAVIEKTRALTADDITDEMVQRASEVIEVFAPSERWPGSAARWVLEAALTEPQRPEGAENIEALLEGMPADLIGGPLTAHEARTLADHLAEHGVRVTTEEER